MKGLILILDDNPMDLKIASSATERSGYASYGFTDHLEAMGWLKDNRPSIILLDLQMPAISGYEVISLIKNNKSLADIPIIIVSGKNQSEDIKKAIKLGATDYIVKPLDPLVIQEKLRRVESTSESEFYSVDIDTDKQIAAHIINPISIISMSEFGIKIRSSTKLKPGETIEVRGLSSDIFGKEQLLLRCLNCDSIVNSTDFVSQMTYIGIQESQRQIIRKYCRHLWLQLKRGAA